MVLIESIITEAVKRGTSDIHLLNGLKPILRVARDLVEISEVDPIDEETLYDIYDYILRRKCYKRWNI